MCQGNVCVAQKYFDLYRSRDLAGLEKVLCENASLSDWEQEVVGRTNIISLAAKSFYDFHELKILVQSFLCGGSIAYAELMIDFGNGQNFNVVDVLSIKNLKIEKINAYKK